MIVNVVDKNLCSFLDEQDQAYMQQAAEHAHTLLSSGKGAGNDFLGWQTYPEQYDPAEFSRVKKAAKKIRDDSDILIVIGIGGSYLGALSAIELLKGRFYNLKQGDLQIFFAGNNISASYLNEVMALCEGKKFLLMLFQNPEQQLSLQLLFVSLNNIWNNVMAEKKRAKRIYVTTDRHKGTLKALADVEGYETFVVPDDIGGRYSVLTSVGLLPIAAAGCDIDAIMQGAQQAMKDLSVPGLENPAYHYAALRNVFYRKGKTTEILVGYEPDMVSFAEWFSSCLAKVKGKTEREFSLQLFAFLLICIPWGNISSRVCAIYSKPYCSLNIQNRNTLFLLMTPMLTDWHFSIKYQVSKVNRIAFQSALLAHTDGGVPNIVLEVDRIDAFTYGYLVYFFEKSCAASGYMLGVNPFNQPGVEDYKVIVRFIRKTRL